MQEEGSGLSTEQTIDTGLPLIGSAIKIEWFKEVEREGGRGRAAPSEFTLVLSPVFVHCVRLLLWSRRSIVRYICILTEVSAIITVASAKVEACVMKRPLTPAEVCL